MNAIWVLYRREFVSYFVTPVAYVFIVFFLGLLGALTFFLGGFFGRGQADLGSFFTFHTWLYLLLIPAISMRLWSEERKTGTIELLLTLPISPTQAVIAKFLAAWTFAGIAVALTFPIWITVNYLGEPDNGVVFAGYVGSLVMAGAYLAIGSCFSAASKNQVVAFVLAVLASLLFTVAGTPLVLDVLSNWAPTLVINTVAGLSFTANFDAISKGVLDLVNLIYFVSVMALFLFINVVLVNIMKAR
jgi:ABC-2 type transport system permease protein